MMAVQPIPKDYRGAIPYLIVKGAAKAMEFYQRAFGAVEKERVPMPDGRIGHAEVRIGDAVIMLADEFADMKILSPQTLGGSPVSILVYVENVDARFEQAIAAGATVQRAVKDQFYGDRSGTLVDPFGHIWTLATHVEDVSPEQMQKRMASMHKPA
jgi:PhnB protein